MALAAELAVLLRVLAAARVLLIVPVISTRLPEYSLGVVRPVSWYDVAADALPVVPVVPYVPLFWLVPYAPVWLFCGVPEPFTLPLTLPLIPAVSPLTPTDAPAPTVLPA